MSLSTESYQPARARWTAFLLAVAAAVAVAFGVAWVWFRSRSRFARQRADRARARPSLTQDIHGLTEAQARSRYSEGQDNAPLRSSRHEHDGMSSETTHTPSGAAWSTSLPTRVVTTAPSVGCE